MKETLSLRAAAGSEVVRLGVGLFLARCLLGFVFRFVPPLSGESGFGIVSKGTLDHLDSRQNYLYFFVGVLICTLTLVVSLMGFQKPAAVGVEGPATSKRKRDFQLSLRYYLGDALSVRAPAALERLTARNSLWVVIACFAIAVWALNIEFVELAARIKYGYHEGEYLGFAASILQSGKPFSSTFFIHGFGINAWPELLAHTCGFIRNGVPAARLFRAIESSLTWLSGGWLLFELVRSQGKRRLGFVFAMALLVFCSMQGILYVLTLRRLVSFVQLALLLVGVRLVKEQQLRGMRLVFPFLVGALLPLSLLYDYSEALGSMAVFAGSCLLVPLWGRGAAVRWGLASFSGVLFATALMGLVLGPVEAKAMLAQIGYWAHYGRVIWYVPLEASQLAHSKLYHELIFAPALASAYLLFQRQRHGGWVAALKESTVVLILLFASLIGDRIGLDRALDEHLGWSGVNSFLLLLAMGLSVVVGADAAEQGRSGLGRTAVVGLGVLLVLHGMATNGANLSPALAVEHLRAYSDAFWTDERDVMPYTYQEAIDGMGHEIAHAKTFYTLTSEGAWYHYLDKPSSSAFHQLTYARAPEAQARVIQDLETARPEFVLTSDSVLNDGLSADLGTPQVYRYVLEHYRPYRRYNVYWFWKRADRSVWESASDRTPVIGGITQQVDEPSGLSAVNGQLVPPSWLAAQEPIRLYLTSEPEHRLLAFEEYPPRTASAAHAPVLWTAEVPTGFLGAGPHSLGVWLYDPCHDGLVRVATPK